MKKAQGSNTLGIIFGFFILLIVTLVILGIFFKSAEKGEAGMEGASGEYFTKQQISVAVNECNALCDKVNSIDTAIEFCKKAQKIDFNGNGNLNELAGRGRYKFCEDSIPCFVLTDCTKRGYGPDEADFKKFAKCEALLTQYAITKPGVGSCTGINWVLS